MENSSAEEEAPQILLSDYIEIAYLSVVLLIGIPMNVIILRRLIREQRLSNRDTVKSGFVMLKINLNITDLLILAYAFGKLTWLITYQWVMGDFLCRFYQMFAMFSLYSSSNIVVCIALDRLRNVLYANQLHTKSKKITTVTLLAILSWTLALVCSLPQFVLFHTLEVYPNFTQCSDIWQISRHRSGETGKVDSSFILSQLFENTYNIVHLVLVFWGPLLVLIITYALIATKLMKYSIRAPGSQSIRLPLPTTDDSARDVIIHMNIENSITSKGNCLNQLVCPEETSLNKPNKVKSKKFKIREKKQSNSLTVGNSSTLNGTTSPRVPTWRRQLRSKVFRTTMLVILTHFLFWFPYNALGMMKYVNQPLFEILSANANIFKDLQILITLINPFMYGFSSSSH